MRGKEYRLAIVLLLFGAIAVSAVVALRMRDRADDETPAGEPKRAASRPVPGEWPFDLPPGEHPDFTAEEWMVELRSIQSQPMVEVCRREDTLSGLARCGEEAVPYCEEMLDRGPSETAVIVLGRMGEPGIPLLTETLDCENDYVRALAAEYLGKIGAPARSAGDEIRELLADDNWRVREKAGEALSRMCFDGLDPVDASSIPELERLAEHDVWQVRRDAKRRLARLRGEGA